MSEAAEAVKPIKSARRKRRPAAKPAVKATGEFAGLTTTECGAACTAARCVISGRGYCAHPHKGGLQGADTGENAAVSRFQGAQKMLGKAAVEKRFG